MTSNDRPRAIDERKGSQLTRAGPDITSLLSVNFAEKIATPISVLAGLRVRFLDKWGFL